MNALNIYECTKKLTTAYIMKDGHFLLSENNDEY